MTRARAGPDGTATVHMQTYYGQRSSAGLIVAEATNISPQATGLIRTPGIYTANQINAWSRVTDAVHARCGTIFLQLSHMGRLAHPSLQGGALPVAPSAIDFSALVFTVNGMVDAVRPRELRTQEVSDIVEDYARATANALAAGFDGVEIHGASGMLPMQFLHSSANVRTDDYGGSVERRGRFMLELVDACLCVSGPHRTGVRLCPSSAYGDTQDRDPLETYTHLFQQLRSRPLGYVHLVEGPPAHGGHEPESYERSYKALARRFLSCRVIAAGGYERESGNQVIAAGVADAVAFGSLYISNPDLVERFTFGWRTEAKPDAGVYYGEGTEGYVDFPAMTSAEDSIE